MGGLVPRDASSGRCTAVASWLPETGNRGARGREGPAGKRVKSSSSGRRARIAGAGRGWAPSCRASTVSCTRSQSERARPASRLTAGRVAGARQVQPGPARLPQTAASAAQHPLHTTSRRPGVSVRYFKSFSACQTEHEEAYQLTPQRDARGPPTRGPAPATPVATPSHATRTRPSATLSHGARSFLSLNFAHASGRAVLSSPAWWNLTRFSKPHLNGRTLLSPALGGSCTGPRSPVRAVRTSSTPVGAPSAGPAWQIICF